MLTALLVRCRDDRGATSVEYAILASLIAGVIVGAVTTLGLQVLGLFDQPTLLGALAP